MSRAFESRALEIRTLLAMTLPCPYRQVHCTDCVNTTHCGTRENNCVFFKPNAQKPWMVKIGWQFPQRGFIARNYRVDLFIHAFSFPIWITLRRGKKHTSICDWAQQSVCANSVSTFKTWRCTKTSKNDSSKSNNRHYVVCLRWNVHIFSHTVCLLKIIRIWLK